VLFESGLSVLTLLISREILFSPTFIAGWVLLSVNVILLSETILNLFRETVNGFLSSAGVALCRVFLDFSEFLDLPFFNHLSYSQSPFLFLEMVLASPFRSIVLIVILLLAYFISSMASVSKEAVASFLSLLRCRAINSSSMSFSIVFYRDAVGACNFQVC